MPLPEGLATFMLAFEHLDPTGAPAHVGMEGHLSTSRPLLDASGARIEDVPVKIAIGADGTATMGPLPRNDELGGFSYSMVWQTSGRHSPGNKVFRVLADAPDVVNYSELTPIPQPDGDVVNLPTVRSIAGLTGAPTADELAEALDVELRAAFDAWAYRPGTEFAFAEARSGVNASTTTVNTHQDLSFAGLQVVVPPMDRPALVRASGTMSHSVSAGIVGLRIVEVSNGVDTPLIRSELGWPTGGVGAVSPFYANLKPEVRVPAGTRERTFRLSYFNGTAGTATVHTPGNDTASPGAPNSTWQLFIQGIVL